MTLLSEEQIKHLRSIEWLISDTNRQEGRTTVLAIAFLNKSRKNLGQNIKVFDHDKYSGYPIIGVIRKVFEERFNQDQFVLVTKSNSEIYMIRKNEDSI